MRSLQQLTRAEETSSRRHIEKYEKDTDRPHSKRQFDSSKGKGSVLPSSSRLTSVDLVPLLPRRDEKGIRVTCCHTEMVA